MRYVRTGELQPDTLNKLHEFQPKEEFNRGPLKRIDILLTIIHEDYPDKLTEFISNQVSNYESLLNEENTKNHILI